MSDPIDNERTIRGRKPRVSEVSEPRKILIRTDSDQHRAILRAAAIAGVSMNTWINTALAKAASRQKAR